MANFDVIVRAVDQTKGTFQSIERSLAGIQGMAARVGGALAGAFSAKAVVDAAVSFQKLDTAITAAVGSAKSGQAFTQLTGIANELGVSVVDLTGAFKNLKSTGLDTSASSLTAWAKLAAASGSTVEQIADAIGNVYQGSFGKIGKATNDLIEVENKYGQFVVRIGGVVQGTVANTGQVVNMLANYAQKNQNYTDALDKQSKSIQASFSRFQNAATGAVSASGVDQSIANFIDKFVKLEQESGALSKALGYLATGINFIGDNLKAIGVVIATIGIVALGQKFIALAKVIYEGARAFNGLIMSFVQGGSTLFGFISAAGKQIGFLDAAFKVVSNSIVFIARAFTTAIETFGPFIGVLVGAGAATGIFGTTIAKLGAIVLRFLGGPWGLLITGVIAFSDEILKGIRYLGEFMGLLDKKVELKVDANKTEETFKRLGITPSTAGGGRGSMGGPTAQELADYNKSKLAAPGAGKPADTFLADLIGNFGKARSELKQLQAAMARIQDLDLLSKMFAEASSRAEQFGIALEKPAKLIQRDYALAVNKATEELRQHEIQLANDVVTQQKWKNELQETNLQIYEQSLKLADSAYMQKKWWQEIAQTNNTLRENALKLKDNQIQIDLFSQELQTNAQALQQQEQRLGMASQMAVKFAQEIQSGALTLKESAMKLADINYQQGLFSNNLETSRQNTRQQQITLELLNSAYAAGTISLQEYAQMLSTVDDRMLGSAEAMRKALDGANAAIKGQDNSTQATKDLTQQLRTGAISWRQYEQAINKLDSEGVKKSFINTSREIERAKSMAEAFAETLTESVTKAGDTLANSLTDGIMKGQLKLSSFKDFFGSILNDIAAMIVKKNFVNPIVDQLTSLMGLGGQGGNMLGGLASGGGFNIGSLFKGFDLGNVFGGVGDFFGNIGSWFGGLFADGGYLPSGKVGIVGEAGPEVITGPASITPMDQIGSTTVNPQVNFTINAVDTQTGVEFLLKNKPQIVGMIQSAYNSQGKQGIYR